MTVNLLTGLGSGGDAQGDILGGIENIMGSTHADTLIGDGGTNIFLGLAGDDTINGGPGMDAAVFSGTRLQYQITQNPNGSFRILDRRAGAPDCR